jgi:hypothetical protein
MSERIVSVAEFSRLTSDTPQHKPCPHCDWLGDGYAHNCSVCRICGQWPEKGLYCDECWRLKVTISMRKGYSEPWIRAEVKKMQRQLERRRRAALGGWPRGG